MGDIEQRDTPPDSREERAFTIETAASIAKVEVEAWNACAFPAASGGSLTRYANPFISHAFLSALEESGSASARTGWLPHHLLLKDGSGRLLACMPCYLKSHSLGEYVFDHGWADAYEHAGGDYYPKLQCAVPFTPVTGRRILVPEGSERPEHEFLLLKAAAALAQRGHTSSFHVTFLTREEWVLAGQLGFLQRIDQQFHWQNRDYECFDDFLAALSSRKRKTIRRERQEALPAGIEIERVTGNDLTEAHWDAFFAFYMDTGSRKWGSPYLNRNFFSLISERMADHILLILAKRDGRYIAGALNFIGADTLFGRYWGAIEELPFLHFEVCYYQAIEFAIQHKLKSVEAGAQGAHKLARGYLPATTYSAHFFVDPALRHAVADYLRRERTAVAHEAALLEAESPYRRC
jgi:predicted N-acyltransferase